MIITLDCIVPKTGKKNSHGAFINKTTGKAQVFKRAAGVEAENTWLGLLAPYAPKEPFVGAVSLAVVFYFPLRASDTSTKAGRAKWALTGYSESMPVRPDASNLVEALQDAMTTLRYFEDDAQIVQLSVSKRRSNKPGFTLVLEACE